VGLWYEQFGQTSDEEVLKCLRAAREGPSAGGEARAASGDPPDDSSEETLTIPFDQPPAGQGALEAYLVLPSGAKGLVVFVHGSGSTRRSPRNRYVAGVMQRAGFATLLFDLLTPDEAAEDEVTAELRFDIDLLTTRVIAATRWVAALPRTRGLPVGYFGASTGAAAALASAAQIPKLVAAVVSRGGRPDLVPSTTLQCVRAPVLLVVGSRDEEVLELNRSVLPYLSSARLAIVPGATHLFEEPGTLTAVARLAAKFFAERLTEPTVQGPWLAA
jgi:putative phosphoribosyl transferase